MHRSIAVGFAVKRDMKTKTILLRSASFTAMTGLLVCGCAHTQMTKLTAIRTADRAAEASAYDLAAYKEPKAEFVRPCGPNNDRVWWVAYEPRVALWKTNRLGTAWVTNRLTIVVDPRTGTATKAVMGEPD